MFVLGGALRMFVHSFCLRKAGEKPCGIVPEAPAWCSRVPETKPLVQSLNSSLFFDFKQGSRFYSLHGGL